MYAWYTSAQSNSMGFPYRATKLDGDLRARRGAAPRRVFMALTKSITSTSILFHACRAACVAVPMAVLFAACGAKTGEPAKGPPGGGMPPAEVGVVTVAPQAANNTAIGTATQ